METVVTTKGQVVIPAQIRRKYGIKAGTKMIVIDEDHQIVMKPVTDAYYKSLRGVLRDKSALKALLAERQKDRMREDGKHKDSR